MVSDGDETRPAARLRAAAPDAGESSGPTDPEAAPAAADAPVAADAADAPVAADAADGPDAPVASSVSGRAAAAAALSRRAAALSHRAAVRAGSEVGRFARRPSGRMALPSLLLLGLVAVTAGAGAYLVSGPGGERARATAGPSGAGQPTVVNGQTAVPGDAPTLAPTLDPTAAPTLGPTAGDVQRPADALATWAQQVSAKIDVPPVALEAYGYAELVLAQTRPTCRLSWTTLAAIGKVESNHGRAKNASLLADGRAVPAIIGPALDGTGGRKIIRDTDIGALDGDRTWDRAVGPMQFLPSTWAQHAIDADNDGVRDPNDIDDAALTAAYYLCGADRDLSTAAGWWAAVLAYNEVQPYAQAVFTAANDYGVRSRT
ncbi:MAG TPA: lytic murein transglycosylase [Micromonosporaceae bacterium]